MPEPTSPDAADTGSRRVSYRYAKSHATREALMQAALALWRTTGYAETTVAQICKAAGVSKALFYFYFPSKEDLLFEIGVVSTRDVHATITRLLLKPYDIETVLVTALKTIESTMLRYPRELVHEGILEGYRREYRMVDKGGDDDRIAPFMELFSRAREDGLLPPATDIDHLARLARAMVGDGARRWAAGEYGDRSFATVVGGDIAVLATGFAHQGAPRRDQR